MSRGGIKSRRFYLGKHLKTYDEGKEIDVPLWSLNYLDNVLMTQKPYLFRYEKLLFDMGRIEKGEQVVMKFNKAETVGKKFCRWFSFADFSESQLITT